jgi:hypothetical protein
LRKVQSAANEQATLNVPTERKVVQRLAGEPGRAIANEAFIVVMKSTGLLYMPTGATYIVIEMACVILVN